MGEIIRAVAMVETTGPLIFLAGPIQGAVPWQEEAIIHINSLANSIHIASPRSLHTDSKSWSYETQVDWETHYLNQAAQRGVVLFWLAKEHRHICTRAYAQTSRFELAEWKEKHRRGEAKLVVGIEPGFSGERYIKRRLSQDCPGITIHDTLKDTCSQAASLATS